MTEQVNTEATDSTNACLPADQEAVFDLITINADNEETSNVPADWSNEDAQQLEAQEAIIRGGMQTFLNVCRAFHTILSQRLYHQKHKTFEEYCRQEWNLGRRHGMRLADSGKIVNEMQASGATRLPVNESQARALKNVPNEQRQAVLEKANEAGPATAASIEAAADEIESEESNESAEQADDDAGTEEGESNDVIELVPAKDDQVTYAQFAARARELKLLTFPELKDKAETIRNISSNSQRRQELVNLVAELYRTLEGYADLEAEFLNQQAA